MNQRLTHSSRVAVVGGGLAGLAAGSVLAHSGFHVTLFERRPYLGGRASSYQHPGTGRSEEHTSELQSLRHLVCRLLLEKKKKPRPRSARCRGTRNHYDDDP